MIAYVKQLDRKQFLIYSFSYLIYLGLNKLFSNTMLYILGEDSFRERWTNFGIPCGPADTLPHVFIISFQVFKIALFMLLLRLSRKEHKGLLFECLIAYFIYDFVYILSFIWESIPLPITLSSWWTLISSGQHFLARYLPHLDLIVAGIWTSALLLLLFKQNRLSIMFLVHRLAIITFSVPVYYFIMYLIWYNH